MDIGAVDDDVAQLPRHRLAGLEGTERLGRDIGRDLDQPPVKIEEAQPVPAAGGLQRRGLADDHHASRAELSGQRVDGARARCAEGDDVQSFRLGLPEPDDIRFGDAGRAQIDDIAIARYPVQAPDPLVEGNGGAQVGNGHGNVPQMGDGGARRCG